MHVLRITTSIALVLSAVLMASTAQAEAEKIQVLPLDNKAGLGSAELEFLSDLVSAAFSQLPQEGYSVHPTRTDQEAECDDACRVDLAREAGATWLVTGAITPFGDGYSVVVKLYRVETGQLRGSATGGPKPTLEELQSATEHAACDVRDKLAPVPRPTAAPVPVPEQQPASSARDKSAVTAVLRIASAPPGARVYVSRDEDERGTLEGQTPLVKELLPLTYWVTLTLEDHFGVTRKIRLDPADDVALNLHLKHDYPANPYRKAGHAFFWSGVGVAGFGIFAAIRASSFASNYEYDLDEDQRQSARAWTGVMWGSFGVGAALMTAGVVAWIKSPGDEKYFEQHQADSAAWLSPTDDGGLAFAYSRRF